jgi:hypothetical protein
MVFRKFRGILCPCISCIPILKALCHEIFASGFFHESYSSKPLKITLGSFQFFLSQGALLVSRTPVENFSTGTAGVVDIDGKFATDVHDTSSKFANNVNNIIVP